MRVLENRVSRKLFEPKRDEVTGVEKTTKRGAVRRVLVKMFYLTDKINENRMGGAYVTYGGENRCMHGSCRETFGKETT